MNMQKTICRIFGGIFLCMIFFNVSVNADAAKKSGNFEYEADKNGITITDYTGKEKKIKYDYIHGKANINKNVKTSNLVLGIDEYLNDERKDSELEFLVFKKFYQRVYKSTDNDYLNWIDRIRDEYANYIENKNNMLESYRNSHYSVMKHIYLVFAKEKIPKHNLYIFGHSLDITDRDVLRLFICNDNVQTKIFYYRENEEDKRTLGRLIKNLIQIIGQEELIKRTGGLHKTIEFIPQAIS